MGCYSGQEVKMLLVMCRRIEAVSIYRLIKSIDEDAFITQSNVNGVYGRGFDQIKVKSKKRRKKELTETSADAGSLTSAEVGTEAETQA